MSGPPEYGPSLTLDAAKRVMAAAEAEAVKNNWPMVIAIMDVSGRLLMLHRMDNAQNGSVIIAQRKAETAVNFKRPTKAFEDLIAQGGVHLRMLSMDGVIPLEGGLPIMQDGRVVGAIGVSGMASSQDSEVARAGIAAL
jgi:glc operon protein GlcG